MKIILRYIFLTAVRDWLFLGLLICLFFAFGLSAFISNAALSEQLQMQLALFGGTSRLIISFGMILFICFHIHRSFETRETLYIMSKNISRYEFITAYWLGFNFITLLLLIPVFILMLFLKANTFGLIEWSISLWLELLIISTFAIISSLILKSAVSSVLGTSGFYLMSRLMGFFSANIAFSYENRFDKIFTNTSYFLMRILSILFPRLDLFAQTKLLVYGSENSIFTTIIIQSVIYILIMLCIAFYDFRKKEF